MENKEQEAVTEEVMDVDKNKEHVSPAKGGEKKRKREDIRVNIVEMGSYVGEMLEKKPVASSS